jgi:hypothetical protein
VTGQNAAHGRAKVYALLARRLDAADVRMGDLMARVMRRWVAVAALPALAVAGCSSGGSKSGGDKPASQSTAPAQISVSGKVLITDGESVRQDDKAGTTCWTKGNSPVFAEVSPLDDIKDGAQVVVSDANGKTAGLGTLSSGRTTRTASGASGDFPDCEFTFIVSNVPSGQSFYGIKVGDHSKQVSAADINSPTITLP